MSVAVILNNIKESAKDKLSGNKTIIIYPVEQKSPYIKGLFVTSDMQIMAERSIISILEYLRSQGAIEEVALLNQSKDHDYRVSVNPTKFKSFYDRIMLLTIPFVEEIIKYQTQPEANARKYPYILPSDNSDNEVEPPIVNTKTPSISYDHKKLQLVINEWVIDIPAVSDQELFCKRLFPKGKLTKKPVEKGDLFEVFGHDPYDMSAEQRADARKELYSAKDALNRRIFKDTKHHISDFFVVDKSFWVNKIYL